MTEVNKSESIYFVSKECDGPLTSLNIFYAEHGDGLVVPDLVINLGSLSVPDATLATGLITVRPHGANVLFTPDGDSVDLDADTSVDIEPANLEEVGARLKSYFLGRTVTNIWVASEAPDEVRSVLGDVAREVTDEYPEFADQLAKHMQAQSKHAEQAEVELFTGQYI